MNSTHSSFQTAMNEDITHHFTNKDITQERKHIEVYKVSFQNCNERRYNP